MLSYGNCKRSFAYLVVISGVCLLCACLYLFAYAVWQINDEHFLIDDAPLTCKTFVEEGGLPVYLRVLEVRRIVSVSVLIRPSIVIFV